MRFNIRLVGLVPALALAGSMYWVATASSVGAYTPTVTIFDNDAPPPSQGYDPGQAMWGYGPAMTVVRKGEQVVFNNAASNRLPHTVTSIDRGAAPFESSLGVGGKFDSSPSRETLIMRGSSWTLDTSTLDPGTYAYYCRIHPWMVGAVSVMAE